VREAADHLDKTVQSVYLVRSKQVRSKRNGESYIALQRKAAVCGKSPRIASFAQLWGSPLKRWGEV
jgi:hypothetical protein